MTKLMTAEDAAKFWAPQGAAIAQLAKGLDDLLPNVGDEAVITPETREAVEEAFGQVLLAMDTILGAYTRVLHGERTAIAQYQPPGGMVPNRNGQPGGYGPQQGWQPQ